MLGSSAPVVFSATFRVRAAANISAKLARGACRAPTPMLQPGWFEMRWSVVCMSEFLVSAVKARGRATVRVQVRCTVVCQLVSRPPEMIVKNGIPNSSTMLVRVERHPPCPRVTQCALRDGAAHDAGDKTFQKRPAKLLLACAQSDPSCVRHDGGG